MEQQSQTREFHLEQRSIDYIPATERHGRPVSLLTLWFASNVQVTGLVTGALVVFIGLGLAWGIAAIIIGNLAGAIFMAYHSAQGPKLGIAQMIQSRAQFGRFGAILPLVIVVAMYIGFFVTGGILGGQALAALLHIPFAAGAIIGDALIFLIALVGYDLIHSYARITAILSAVLFLAITIKLATQLPAHYHPASQSAGTILLAISIIVSWQITWAPYVSDYSRYLPQDTKPAITFWYTFIGSGVGATWVMIIGALAAIVAPAQLSADSSGYLAGLFPAVKWLLLIVIFLGVAAANVENLYGSFLSALAGVSATGKIAPGPVMRGVATFIVAVVGTVIAILASTHFITDLTNFVLFLLYLLIPWTAINLTDYYLVRRGQYSIPDIFAKDGGIYGRFNTWALAIFVVTILIELPFMNSAIYTGPLAKDLGGADISWIVGLTFAIVAYYVVARWELRRQHTAKTADATSTAAPGS